MDTIAKLQERFAKALSDPVELEKYEGGEWWQLHPAEAYVFGLEPADMPALIAAWEFYEAIADVTDNDFHDTPLCIEARAALPFIKQDGTDNPLAWERFAALLGIRGRKAHAWFHKFMFSLDRDGVAQWADDDMPMPRASTLPKPTHGATSDSPRPDIDDPIPF